MALGRWPLDEPFPAVLTDADLRRVLGIGRSQFFAKKAAGSFDFLRLRPDLGGHAQYSGRLVEAWVSGAHGARLRRVS